MTYTAVVEDLNERDDMVMSLAWLANAVDLVNMLNDLLEDICDRLPEADDIWSAVDHAKKKLNEVMEPLEEAINDLDNKIYGEEGE